MVGRFGLGWRFRQESWKDPKVLEEIEKWRKDRGMYKKKISLVGCFARKRVKLPKVKAVIDLQHLEMMKAVSRRAGK